MEPKDYKLTSLKPGDYKDQRGNVWCEATFEGIGEPVKWVVKDPNAYQVGQVIYGHVEAKTSQTNRVYQRFYRDQPPDAQAQLQRAGGQPDDKYWAERNSEIRAQWAIGQSVALWNGMGLTERKDVQSSRDNLILKNARTLYGMVGQVAGSDTHPAPETPPQVTQVSKAQPQRAVSWKDEPPVDEWGNADAEINLDDIPY